jgi:polysaccharide deacetylase family protein (PEP-CTERM system associated)
MLNALTIDVEEWFCVSNFDGVIPRECWAEQESRLEEPMDRILDLLERHAVRATVFVLGWIAERHPRLVREIHERGHEIGSHGYEHTLVGRMTPEQFRADLARSLDVLRRTSGAECRGYRAPSFSLRRDMDWAWQALCAAGIRYDSSIFPVLHDRYGEPDAPRFSYPVHCGAGQILEVPPSTVHAFGRNIPVAGGGYFRLYPLAATRWAVRRINREGHPAVVYLHPWEFDPDHPAPATSRFTLLRHRVGLRTVAAKLERLLGEFPFGSMAEVIARGGLVGAEAPQVERAVLPR